MNNSKKFGALEQFYLSCLWFAYNAQWGALLAVVLPKQIEWMAGSNKYFFNGLIGPVGAFVALLVTPVSGALSDRNTHPKGRRRPYLIWGITISTLFLAWMATFKSGSNIWLFAVCMMGVQFGCNWWGGPYTGMIPDVVPEDLRGRASGWMALMTAVGTIVGALAAGELIKSGNLWPVFIMIIASLWICLGITLYGVKETPLQKKPAPFDFKSFIRSFWIDPKIHMNFYWVLLTRGMVMMGVYSIFSFFQYFFGDVLHAQDPAEQAGFLVGIVTAAGIPSAVLGGVLADRVGRKPMVYLSGAVLAIASLIFIAIIFYPTLSFTYLVASLFGIGYGAYQAVDWALAIDVLPAGEDAAKDMGIWHVSMVLPQMIGPFITGAMLSFFQRGSDGVSSNLLTGYTYVFAITSVWFILGTVFVYKIKNVK